MKSENRIGILDSFRCIAVMMVVLYHFFSGGGGITNFYPFKDKFINTFKYGYLGVELFFIISGYVIFMTLERCQNKKDFFLKRLIRLYPLLFICSIITFVLPFLIDNQHSFSQVVILYPKAIYFLPSLTFSDLWIWNQIFHKKIQYIDNVYWSLVVEVKFYFFSAIIYFFKKEKFLLNWMILAGLTIVSYLIISKLGYYNVSKVIGIFFIAKYIGYFSLGILFYKLSKKEKIGIEVFLLAILILFCQAYQIEVADIIYLCFFIVLFLVFIYKPMFLSFLNNSLFTTIGIISYPLYLIHCSSGLLVLFKLSSVLGLTDNAWMLLIFIIPFFIFISYLLHNYIEKSIASYLRKLFFNK